MEMGVCVCIGHVNRVDDQQYCNSNDWHNNFTYDKIKWTKIKQFLNFERSLTQQKHAVKMIAHTLSIDLMDA